MTRTGLAVRGLQYYWRTHAAVGFGVAIATAVLAGSLLVGASVHESLRMIASSRLGSTSVVVGAALPFTAQLGDRLAATTHAPVAPMLAVTGVAVHERSSRRAGNISVYGVDARFFEFHASSGVAPSRNEALVSVDLANELGIADGDALIVRVARPTDIPLDSLHGRRDEASRAIRVTVKATLARAAMGDFTLLPGQGPARGVFLSLDRLQRDLGLENRINTVLIGGGPTAANVTQALSAAMTPADMGLTISKLPESNVLLVESSAGLIPDATVEAVTAVAAGKQGAQLISTPVLTWLATRMTVNGRMIPYSLVSAIGAEEGQDALAAMLRETGSGVPIVLNEWAARELQAAKGDPLDLEFLRWSDEGGLVSGHSTFRVGGVLPMRGIAVDRRLAPDYPGITTATDLGDWDPPFPIDLGLVRPQDEAYWDQYKTAPKAFIPLAAGQSIWRTRHGQVTSIRLRPETGGSVPTDSIDAVARAVTPARAGFNVIDVRAQNLSAAQGATDFGAYFSYFSFFLMAAAILLAGLFFRLGIENRLQQIGVLRAAGFSLGDVRGVFLREGAAVAAIGGMIGAALAVGWAALMMFALRTWWVGAVGTTQLQVHVDPILLALGAVSTALGAMIAIAWTIRALGRTSPRAQLSGSSPDFSGARRSGGSWLAIGTLGLAATLSALSFLVVIPPAAGFFGAGVLIVASGLLFIRAWLLGGPRIEPRSLTSLGALGLKNAAWRPGRSLTVVGLVAASVFLLVAVDSFRKTTTGAGSRDSGTGGFSLVAETAVPIAWDLQSTDGRRSAGINTQGGTAFDGVEIYGLRLRPGDDASCLNLYQPKQPRVVGVSDRFREEGRFGFARSVADSEEDRRNPWRLLEGPDADGIVPAIADQTSLQYVLHAAVGDVITIDADTVRPARLRIVASLADSIFQGELLVSDAAFRSLFPENAGFRVFLISTPGGARDRIDAVSTQLESDLEPFGFDAQETSVKLEAFHRVENTYLSTFQTLGGLGLMLGCLGLVAVVLRNLVERRRELALLGAAGFGGGQLRRLVAIEHIALVVAGLLIGVAAAGVAVAPVVLARSGGVPWHALAWVVPVGLSGLAATLVATSGLRRMGLATALRND